MKFSEKLINLRKSKGMSQEDLAMKLNVTRQTISKWELDQTAPDMNKLIEMSKLFEVSLDELTNNIEISGSENAYKESVVEKNNKNISIKIFIVGLIISIILCGIGFVKQGNAKKTNEERAQQAYQQSQNAVDAANKRIEELNNALIPLYQQYEVIKQESDSLNMGDSNWFAEKSRLEREASSIKSQINALESEGFLLQNKDYTGYYQLVKPITYLIFYYIAAGVFVLLSLIALIYFLATRKK